MTPGADEGERDDRLVVVVPGHLDTRTGGYGYDRRIVHGLRALGWQVDVRELGGGFPFPTADALSDAARVLGACAPGTRVLIDGLAFGAMPEVVEASAAALTLVALVHHPLSLETGLDPASADALRRLEHRALRAARMVIVTSRQTAALLAGYDVPTSKIVVVEPGADPAPLAAADGRDPLRLLTVAAVVPRKGHAILVRALETLGNRGWHLTCAGSVTRDPSTTAQVVDLVAACGLAGRVLLTGELDDAALDAGYARADLFVLPTLYEGYGMAVAEALARGIPVVASDTGAIADLVGADAGLIVPPGDVDALATALARVLDDGALRARLRRGARRARERLPRWEDASRQVAAAVLGATPGPEV